MVMDTLPPSPSLTYPTVITQQAKPKLGKIEQLNQSLNNDCQIEPDSDSCTLAIREMLHQIRKANLHHQLSSNNEYARTVLTILYNGKDAKELIVKRLNDINSRADFFAVNDIYYQSLNIPIKWFNVADKVSRECITGLGAHHCASYITFASTKLLGNPKIYAWRQEAGDTILSGSFNNFKTLFNAKSVDTTTWDINQLKYEQSLLQPIHTKYLAKYRLFRFAYKNVMRIHIKKGVNILDLNSRIRYGCYRMAYLGSRQCQY